MLDDGEAEGLGNFFDIGELEGKFVGHFLSMGFIFRVNGEPFLGASGVKEDGHMGRFVGILEEPEGSEPALDGVCGEAIAACEVFDAVEAAKSQVKSVDE